MHHHPSTTTTTFSSSLLNHIFLSIDDHHHDPPADHHDRPISALRRSRLLHKWMVDKPNSPSFTPVVPPPPPRRRPSPSPPPPPVVLATADEDPDSFFSTTSVSSSDSSSGGLSSSETPSFDPSSKPKSSCFGPLRAPRPIKTKPPKPDDPSQDNDHNSSTNRSSASSRAARFYTQLKSLKQPISPGLKLAKYINSLTKKKTTKNSPDRKFRGIPVPDRRYKSEQASPEWCISAPKKLGNESSVPAADIKAGSRPALMKRYEELRRMNTADIRQEDDHDHDNDDKTDLNRKVLEEVALDLLNGYWTRRRNEENADRERHDDDDDDDDSSCSSSDLFEIDHLSVIGNSELPVYETTTTTTTTTTMAMRN